MSRQRMSAADFGAELCNVATRADGIMRLAHEHQEGMAGKPMDHVVEVLARDIKAAVERLELGVHLADEPAEVQS